MDNLKQIGQVDLKNSKNESDKVSLMKATPINEKINLSQEITDVSTG